jgi:hypothetical protein
MFGGVLGSSMFAYCSRRVSLCYALVDIGLNEFSCIGSTADQAGISIESVTCVREKLIRETRR